MIHIMEEKCPNCCNSDDAKTVHTELPIIENPQWIPDTREKLLADELREIHRGSSAIITLEKEFDKYNLEEGAHQH